jgi:hypothetical protein
MALFSAEQLSCALEGVSFPARRWQLGVWADGNCAPSELREALRHLPDQVYRGTGHLVDTFAAIERRAALVGVGTYRPARSVAGPRASVAGSVAYASRE